MKALRITGIVLISIFMVIVTCLFTYSFAFKEMVKGVATDIIDFSSIGNSELNMSSVTDDPKVKEIMENKDVQDFINKYIDTTLEGFSGKDVDVDLSGDLIELIENNKEVFNEAGIEISEDDINEFKNSDDYNELNKQYSELFDEVREDTSNSEMGFIRTFSFMGTNSFRIVCLVLIFVSVLLIGLLSWSLYKWLLPIGIDSLVSGILTLGGGVLISMFSTAVLKGYTIKTISLFATGGALLIVGIIMIILYVIFNKKGKKNEVSKVSE